MSVCVNEPDVKRALSLPLHLNIRKSAAFGYSAWSMGKSSVAQYLFQGCRVRRYMYMPTVGCYGTWITFMMLIGDMVEKTTSTPGLEIL